MAYQYSLNIHVLDGQGNPVKGALVTVTAGGEPIVQGRSSGEGTRPLKLRFDSELQTIRIAASHEGRSDAQDVPVTARDLTFKLDVNTLVLLVHGIRDFARWNSHVAHVLRQAGFKVASANYGRMNLVQFLLPFDYFRIRAMNKVWTQIQHARELNPGARICVIAHSFGTYVMARLIQREFTLKVDRLIFCGSVVRYDFPFEQLAGRVRHPILNDVGTADPWPAIAEAVTRGYGSAGSFGFNVPGVRDRYHNGRGHGYFLEYAEPPAVQFTQQFWVPFIESDSVVEGDIPAKNPPWWVQLISIFKIKYAVVGAVAGYLVWIGWRMYGGG